jgi:hypothetical protein
MGRPLKELREDWERGLEKISEFEIEPGSFMVVLKSKDRDKKDIYHLHRYMYFSVLGNNWDVSMDCRGSADEVFRVLGAFYPVKSIHES